MSRSAQLLCLDLERTLKQHPSYLFDFSHPRTAAVAVVYKAGDTGTCWEEGAYTSGPKEQ